MNLNYNNEKFSEITKTSKEHNFEEFNTTICNDEHFKLSQRNLIMIYIFLYNFFINNNLTDLNNYLNKTTYFNKIIFLKYLNFFRNLNELQERTLNEVNDMILEFKEEIESLEEQIQTLEESEDYEKNIKTIEKKEKRKQNIETQIVNIKTKQQNIETKIENIKDEFIVNITNILKENKDNINEQLNVDSIIKTLFDENIIENIHNSVITNINNNPASFNEYMALFHLNPTHNNSSDKAIFYIGIHGTLCIVVPNNTYLTIASPVNTTINRWGERGDPIKYFNTMDYTFKQCLLTYGEDLTNDKADTCFNLLGTSKQDFNFQERQTTTAYCEQEPDNFFSNLTDFKKNEKMRIKHYTIDSYDFMMFNTDYTIPDSLLSNLLFKIPELKNIQYSTAENIINLNFLLFNNNINFTIFNLLNIADETGISTFGLYPDIGLYTRYYLQEGNIELQSHLHNFNFPFDIFSFKPKLFTEDFTLDRDIYALNNINIHLKYQDIDRSFILLKGDSFLCNPYIIEYFIKTFNSKISIRPGPILGNKEDDIFKQNKQPTNKEKGSTITCLSKGLSCYKVTLSLLTNYEILKFCKDANINTCDLYDTSCQSFEYLNEVGKIIPDYTPPPPKKQTLQRMNTKDDSTMLAKYDNLSDLFVTLDTPRDFLVVGNSLVKRKPNLEPNLEPNIKRTKIEIGGRTKKRINRKKNTRKRTKRYKNKITYKKYFK